MGLGVVRLGIGLGLLLACAEDGVVRQAPSVVTGGSGGSKASGNPGGSGGSSSPTGSVGPTGSAGSGQPAGLGGAGGVNGLAGSAGAAGSAGSLAPGLGGDAGGVCPCDGGTQNDGSGEAGTGSGTQPEDASACAARGPGGQRLVTLDPSTIEVFSPPIGSTRFAASGFDACARVCASIIWDYSNNNLEVERHCDDFLALPSFPYVVLMAGQDAPCPGLWQYAGVDPSSASGCIDPAEGLVDAEVEVEAEGQRYLIRASNGPSL